MAKSLLNITTQKMTTDSNVKHLDSRQKQGACTRPFHKSYHFSVIEKNKIYKKQRLQHEITKVIVFFMPIFQTGKTVLHQGNENMVSRWNYVCTRV